MNAKVFFHKISSLFCPFELKPSLDADSPFTKIPYTLKTLPNSWNFYATYKKKHTKSTCTGPQSKLHKQNRRAFSFEDYQMR